MLWAFVGQPQHVSPRNSSRGLFDAKDSGTATAVQLASRESRSLPVLATPQPETAQLPARGLGALAAASALAALAARRRSMHPSPSEGCALCGSARVTGILRTGLQDVSSLLMLSHAQIAACHLPSCSVLSTLPSHGPDFIPQFSPHPLKRSSRYLQPTFGFVRC